MLNAMVLVMVLIFAVILVQALAPVPAATCDIMLRFCQLSSDLSQFNSTDRLLGTMCPGTPLFEEFLGFNLMAGVTYSNSNRESLQGRLVVFSTGVVYNGAGRWVNLIATFFKIIIKDFVLYR